MDEPGGVLLYCASCDLVWQAIAMPGTKTNEEIAQAVKKHSACPACQSGHVLYHESNKTKHSRMGNVSAEIEINKRVRLRQKNSLYRAETTNLLAGENTCYAQNANQAPR